MSPVSPCPVRTRRLPPQTQVWIGDQETWQSSSYVTEMELIPEYEFDFNTMKFVKIKRLLTTGIEGDTWPDFFNPISLIQGIVKKHGL